jgi:RNA polymerase sigma-70 factor (ECF subfamily)
MRLCLLLTKNQLTNQPQTNALLALMCLQASREAARTNPQGEIITLKYQDRSLWNKDLIIKGLQYLSIASDGNYLSPYHCEAAIGACHAEAENFENTNWAVIQSLYESLCKIKPGPIVEMNKAIVMGYNIFPEAGLQALLEIKGLEENHLYWAALGDFYSDLNDFNNGMNAYNKAIKLTNSKFEKVLLEKKRSKLLNLGLSKSTSVPD